MDEYSRAPMKQCSKCELFFPATPEFFTRAKIQKDGLRPECKACKKIQTKLYNDAHVEDRKQYYQANKEKINEQSRQYHQSHREEILKQNKQKYELHKEEICERRRMYRKENSTRLAEQRKANYRKQKTKMLLRNKAWRDTNRVKYLESNRRYYETHREQRSEYAKTYQHTHRNRLCEYKKQKYLRERDVISQYRSEHRDIFRDRERRYYRTEHGKQINAAKHGRRRALKMGAGGKYTAQDVAKQFKRQRGTCYYCHKKFAQGKRAYHIDHVIPLTRGGSNDPSNLVLACPRCNTRKHNRLPHEWPEGNRLL